MDHLIRPEDLKIDRKLQEETNPVSATAKMTLFQLAEGGDREAAAVAEKLGLTFEETQTSGSARMAPEDEIALRIMLEIRYHTMKRLAETSGCATVVDLPCGYTPLGLAFARGGQNYLGLDLPAVIAPVREIILPMVPEDKRGLVRFAEADATNDESMQAALSGVDGSLCFLMSGLLMYLSDPELEAMTGSIRKALDQHGGCWITADPEVELRHFSTLKAICGERFGQVFRERYDMIGKKSDTVMGQNVLSIHHRTRKADLAQAVEFLRSHGLQSERLIVADHMPAQEPAAFSLIDETQRDAVRQVLQKTAFWKITSDGCPRPGEKGTGDESAEPSAAFSIRADRKEDLLELELTGRLDTLSSPELLALYEKESAEHGVRKVVLNCSGLSFISSAGLRVLLMIKKGCSSGIAMTGVNESVREIIEKTGFDRLLTADIQS